MCHVNYCRFSCQFPEDTMRYKQLKKTFKVKHRVLKLRFADIANHKREILLFWKDCFLFGGVLILSVKLIMHWETNFNQAMHE